MLCCLKSLRHGMIEDFWKASDPATNGSKPPHGYEAKNMSFNWHTKQEIPPWVQLLPWHDMWISGDGWRVHLYDSHRVIVGKTTIFHGVYLGRWNIWVSITPTKVIVPEVIRSGSLTSQHKGILKENDEMHSDTSRDSLLTYGSIIEKAIGGYQTRRSSRHLVRSLPHIKISNSVDTS